MTQDSYMENTPAFVPDWNGLFGNIRTTVAMGLLSMMVAALIAGFAGCMSAVSNPQDPPVVVIDVKETGTTADLPEYPPEPRLCVRRDHIVLRFDGGDVEYWDASSVPPTLEVPGTWRPSAMSSTRVRIRINQRDGTDMVESNDPEDGDFLGEDRSHG